MFGIAILFLLPVAIGIGLLLRALTGYRTKLMFMAVGITIKASMLLPFWYIINQQSTFTSYLPAFITITFTITVFRSLLWGEGLRRSAWVLLLLHVVQLISGYRLQHISPYYEPSLHQLFELMLLIMPTIIAFAACIIVSNEEQNQPEILQQSNKTTYRQGHMSNDKISIVAHVLLGQQRGF